MPSERRQFRVLYRDFLLRVVDLELLSAGGEIQKLLAQFAAMLAAFSFTVLLGCGPNIVFSTLPHARLARLAWTQEEFLFATTTGIAGLFTLLAWNAVLPDRRDSLVLGLLPVRPRTILLAKLAAVATALGVSVAAVNIFTGLFYPFVAAGPGLWGALRALGAWWLAQAAAGWFVCGALLAVEGMAALLLSRRGFLRASTFLQLAAFGAILAYYFLKPPFPTGDQAVPAWMPSAWFFGFFQQLNGTGEAGEFAPLAARAMRGMAMVFPVAAAAFGLAYRRHLRNAIEQPEAAPEARIRPPARVGRWLAARLLPRPIERAIVLFTARTLVRSRQHRLIFAAYAGIGLAIALAYTRVMLYGSDPLDLQYWRSAWNEVNGPFISASLVLLFFAVTGARAVFALPIALPANWIFRMTAVHRPGAYFAAVRKALFVLAAAPAWLAAAILFPLLWPWRPAAGHVALMAAAAVLLVEFSLRRFRKIPFACSYLPGKANLQVRLGAVGAAFLAAISAWTQLEYWTLLEPVRFAVFWTLIAAAAVWAWRDAVEFAEAPHNRIQFEELPHRDVDALDLRRDGAWSGEGGYIDAVAAPAVRGAVEPVIRRRGVEDWDLGAAQETGRPPLSERLHTGLEQCLRDLAAGLRIFTRAPGFSAAAVSLIALGIGGNTAIYSMIHAVLSKPAPGIHAQGLVVLGIDRQGEVWPYASFASYLVFTNETSTLRSMAAYTGGRFTATFPDGTFELRATQTTASYFDTLGVRFARGRAFTEEEARGAGGLVAVLAYHVWRNQMQSAPDAIGRSILINGHPATIVGVTAEGFHGSSFAPNFEVGVPLVAFARLNGWEAGLYNPANRMFGLMGQLAPGASVAQAQAELDGIAQRLQLSYPDPKGRWRVLVSPYSSTAWGIWQSRQARLFMALLTAVGLLTLLLVCANVANLMLARSVARQREIAVRRSLGAPASRILRVLLAEGLALSLAAWAAAWLFAEWACRAIVKLIPPLTSGARLQPDLTPDARVACYALALAVVSAVAFTLAPAVRAWRQDLLPWLKAGENSVAEGRSKLSGALVVVQLALSVLLLTGAGLASRSVFLIGSLDLQFPKDHLLLVDINTSGAAASEDENIALLERLRARLRAVAGVTACSYATAVPPSNFGGWEGAVQATDGGAPPAEAAGTMAGSGYLEALGMRLAAGRGIAEEDVRAGRSVAVVNRNLAVAFWPRQSPLGRTLLVFGQPVTVIGVAPNAASADVQPGARNNYVYLAEGRGSAPGSRVLYLRYAASLAAIGPAVRSAIRQTDSRVPVSHMRTMDAEMEEYASPAILVTSLLGLFSSGSVLIAAIGLYAVVAFQTARRKRDFGVRLALGASPRQILETVLKEGLQLAAVGGAIGLALSLAAGKAFAGYLYGITPTDAATYAAVIALMTAISLAACLAPARRAARTDPVEALRQE